MSCKTLMLKSCELRGSSFNSRVFKFTNRDIVSDTFTLLVKKGIYVLANIPGVISGNDVIFPLNQIEPFREDLYDLEYWANFEDLGKEMIAFEEFNVSSKPCENCTDTEDISFTLDLSTEVINYEVNFSIVQIGSEMTDLEIKEAYERNLNTNAFTDLEKSKLSTLHNYDDSGIITSLQNKVDKVTGKQLSTNDYTSPEKDKLAGLDSNKFKGKFLTLSDLQLITGDSGSYAYVGGVSQNDQSYIWDVDINQWVLSVGMPTAETPASIKVKYESNLDTNAFTDTDKTKLDTIQPKNYREIFGYFNQPGDDSNPQFIAIGALEIGYQSFNRVAPGEYVLVLSDEVDLNNVFFQNSTSYFEDNHPAFTYGEMFLMFVKAESTTTELKFVTYPTYVQANYPNVRFDGANNAPFYLRILD